MKITASKLRENIYRVLDQVVETGVPVEIERRGRRLKIVPADEPLELEDHHRRDRESIALDRGPCAGAQQLRGTCVEPRDHVRIGARADLDPRFVRRMIVGHAVAAGRGLLTKDRSIRRRFRAAFW